MTKKEILEQEKKYFTKLLQNNRFDGGGNVSNLKDIFEAQKNLQAVIRELNAINNNTPN